jgi:hypothetical protein
VSSGQSPASVRARVTRSAHRIWRHRPAHSLAQSLSLRRSPSHAASSEYSAQGRRLASGCESDPVPLALEPIASPQPFLRKRRSVRPRRRLDPAETACVKKRRREHRVVFQITGRPRLGTHVAGIPSPLLAMSRATASVSQRTAESGFPAAADHRRGFGSGD